MKKFISLALVVCMTALLSSCGGGLGSLLGENPTDKADSYAKALDLVKSKADLEKYKVYSVKFVEGEELSNDMMYVELGMVSPENFAFTQVFYLNGNVGDMNEALNDIDYQKVKGIDITQIDPATIEKQCTEAQSLVPEGHTYKSVGRYIIKEILEDPSGAGKEGQLKTTFDIRFTEDGKETESSGGKVTYVYYEGAVNVNEDGTLSIDLN